MSHRKTPHFYVINPINDRRNEPRFDSKEPIRILHVPTQTYLTGFAYDVGHFGLRLETSKILIQEADRLQIEFTTHADNIGCLGQAAWVEKIGEGPLLNCGVAIESWFGIVSGKDSYTRVKSLHPKKDRRQKLR